MGTTALTVIVVVFSLGGISGAYINPAVTIAFVASGPFPWSKDDIKEKMKDGNGADVLSVVYTHKNIIVQYKKDQIIHVNLIEENPKPLESGRILDMTYSVKWVGTY